MYSARVTAVEQSLAQRNYDSAEYEYALWVPRSYAIAKASLHPAVRRRGRCHASQARLRGCCGALLPLCKTTRVLALARAHGLGKGRRHDTFCTASGSAERAVRQSSACRPRQCADARDLEFAWDSTPGAHACG